MSASDIATSAAQSGDAIPVELDEIQIARKLADALDRAFAHGLWEHADRVATTASKFARGNPALCDRLARLRLAQGAPETALRLIESCAGANGSLRLLRIACLLQVGRNIEAHLELTQWSARSTAPLQARLMHALLELDMGDDRAAVEILLRNLRQIEDPRTLLTLALIGVVQDRREWAGQWADRARRVVAFAAAKPDADLLLGSIGLVDRQSEPSRVAPGEIEALAAEIRVCEDLIEPLAEAARLTDDHRLAGLINGAIARCKDERGDVPSVDQALKSLQRLIEAGGGDDLAESSEPVSGAEAIGFAGDKLAAQVRGHAA